MIEEGPNIDLWPSCTTCAPTHACSSMCICTHTHTQNLHLSEKLVFININPEINGTHVS